MKKTPWFPRNKPPVRSGWYEVCGGFLDNGTGIDDGTYNNKTFRYYDVEKKVWKWIHPLNGFDVAGFSSGDKWRGLTDNAKRIQHEL